MNRSLCCCLLTTMTVSCTLNGIANEPALKVPDGFQAQLYADDDLAHDIHSITFNSLGELVVSGPGYVRTLLDLDKDGRADQANTFADAPATGAQGMFFLGHHLICSGDQGLQLFRDDNHDGKADGPPEVFLEMNAGGEHHVHAIRKGPDGGMSLQETAPESMPPMPHSVRHRSGSRIPALFYGCARTCRKVKFLQTDFVMRTTSILLRAVTYLPSTATVNVMCRCRGMNPLVSST